MRGDNSSLEGNSEELEKPSRRMKEGAARQREDSGPPRGLQDHRVGWMDGYQGERQLGPGVKNPESRI